MRNKHEHSVSVSEEAAFELGVVYSAVKDELVAFAAKEGSPYSFSDVAARVAKLLQAEAVREQFRSPQYLPEMRQNGARHYRGRPPKSGRYELATEAALSASAFADRPLKPRLSAKARKAIGKAQRERWARYHMNKQARRETWKAGKRAQRARRTISEEVTDRGTPRKRTLTPKQLAAMRANAIKARAANRKKKHAPMSAEQRAKISAAMKAAFAERKAAGAA